MSSPTDFIKPSNWLTGAPFRKIFSMAFAFKDSKSIAYSHKLFHNYLFQLLEANSLEDSFSCLK
jgi:hypothetical protein